MTHGTRQSLSKFLTFRGCWMLVLAFVLCGCSTMDHTGTPRSGTEQLLLTNTWDQVLCEVDLRALSGHDVYLETSHIEAADKGLVIATLQRHLLRQGVILKEDKKDAKLVLVVALAAYGTDQRTFNIGLEGTDFSPESSPGLFKSKHQSSVVKLVMFAYETKTSRLLWEAPPISASNSLVDQFILGRGPLRQTSVPDLVVYPATRTRRSRTFPYRPEPPESVTWTSVPDCPGNNTAAPGQAQVPGQSPVRNHQPARKPATPSRPQKKAEALPRDRLLGYPVRRTGGSAWATDHHSGS